ncbi:hypothetical protein [Streptomyces deccanensis]|uniref:hypothetical protein n=1 Tax=Streptomyces deccanensis TaxID=424188 RepID=UPI001EFA667A|nr:hypothetical protein [Streptomyces deccanensis]ULR56168.1 hypothetical protein L3078_29700 [Streptomyces deccanensis]
MCSVPTAIAVTSSDLVLPPHDRQIPPAVVQPQETLEASLYGMHALIEQHGYVIALHSSSDASALTRRLHTVRSVLESDRIALLGVDLPPLGLALLAQQLRQLSVCDFSPGVLASSVRLLAHYIYAGALLGSVAKLDRVPVPLKSHAKSWLPGAQFAVLANPRPQLVRLHTADEEPLAGPEFGTRLLVAQGPQPPSDWVTGSLAQAWQVQGSLPVSLPEGSTRWWGTGKLVEFAAGLCDVSVLYQLVSSVRRETCHWCGLELIGDRCGFCAAPLREPEPPPVRALPRSSSGPAHVLGTSPRGEK